MTENQLTLLELKASFSKGLSGVYPATEINVLFSMVAEAVLGWSRTDLIIRASEKPTFAEASKIRSTLQGLRKGEPVQYLLGKAEFCGMEFFVTPEVLIPRPETEELVSWIIKESSVKLHSILDLGTGSGCIAVSLKREMPHVMVSGVDKSVKALNMAKQNAEHNDVNVEFFAFDILKQEGLGFKEYDIMVSNPPYVTTADKELMKPNVVNYEPHGALFVPDDDPLVFYRKIVDLSDGHLKKGGELFFEINESFGTEIRSLLLDRGFASVEIRKDLNGKFRMAKGVKV